MDVAEFALNILSCEVSEVYELISDLLERLRSSCLSATVDLSSSSHMSTLIR